MWVTQVTSWDSDPPQAPGRLPGHLHPRPALRRLQPWTTTWEERRADGWGWEPRGAAASGGWKKQETDSLLEPEGASPTDTLVLAQRDPLQTSALLKRELVCLCCFEPQN